MVNKYDALYYINFLGDAFISKKINTNLFLEEMNYMLEYNIDYCCLNYVKRYTKEKIFDEYFRHINDLDRYSHSFVAFIASRKYIVKELINFKNDLDFEMYYIHKHRNDYYKNHLIVRKNYFGILPSITKGKWDRINYLKLKKDNPEIVFEKREMTSLGKSICMHIRKKVISYLPQNCRKKIKRLFEKILKNN